jgi:hypothetical protein
LAREWFSGGTLGTSPVEISVVSLKLSLVGEREDWTYSSMDSAGAAATRVVALRRKRSEVTELNNIFGAL